MPTAISSRPSAAPATATGSNHDCRRRRVDIAVARTTSLVLPFRRYLKNFGRFAANLNSQTYHWRSVRGLFETQFRERPSMRLARRLGQAKISA
jgi:hypothetical protein